MTRGSAKPRWHEPAGFLNAERRPDAAIISGISLFSAAVILFFPPLHFDPPAFRWVCLIYALIISVMLGKAISNFLRERTALAALLAASGFLFYLSDLMLLLSWFADLWSWTNEVCMATYYPALCGLAYAMYLMVGKREAAS